MSSLREQLGPIDIYLFDQLLRGRIERTHRILDAGCGRGRNLIHFLRQGFDLHAVDAEPDNVAAVHALATELASGLAPERIRHAAVEALPFEDDAFDVVLSIAVLHFARNDAHFAAMLSEMLRVLAPGGLFFARLASSIGLEEAVQPLGDGRFRLPDGTDRYLVTLERLLEATEEAGASLLDPIKTTNVQGQRCMTTWVLRLP